MVTSVSRPFFFKGSFSHYSAWTLIYRDLGFFAEIWVSCQKVCLVSPRIITQHRPQSCLSMWNTTKIRYCTASNIGIFASFMWIEIFSTNFLKKKKKKNLSQLLPSWCLSGWGFWPISTTDSFFVRILMMFQCWLNGLIQSRHAVTLMMFLQISPVYSSWK